MKTTVILQSNYIPWKGYFDLMHDADEFIIFDDRQYTRRDWRNRNQVKAANGTQWMSIPVISKSKYDQRIDETMVADQVWAMKHWKTLVQLYRDAPHFSAFADRIEALYRAAAQEQMLSRVNRLFLEGMGDILGLKTVLRWSSEFSVADGKTERLVALCQATGADRYISGPAARSYLEPAAFAEAGIDLQFKDYEGYPEYPQKFPPFVHGVTVLDLLFNVGPDAPWYIWGWREEIPPPN
ncbi:MAG: WbqC family protein [Gammaproteobacteria bacterium]|nr:WbqC family protein [Gammaproteobacteria bacterium]